MRVLIDTCVLYPTLLRELILGWAAAGGLTPLWSERILDEWRRVGARSGPRDAEIANAKIAALVTKFPEACVTRNPDTEEGLHLPDPGDVHVLSAAIDGAAHELLTLNTKDFPTNALSSHGIIRRHPDEFLLEALHAEPEKVAELIGDRLAVAQRLGIDTSNRRAILKRARLPRLAKALDQL